MSAQAHHIDNRIEQINLSTTMRTRLSPSEREDLKYGVAVACLAHVLLLYLILPSWEKKIENVKEEVIRVPLTTMQMQPPKSMPTPPPEIKQVVKKKVKPIPIPDPEPEKPDAPPESPVEYTFDDIPDLPDNFEYGDDGVDISEIASAQGLPGPPEPISIGYMPLRQVKRVEPEYPPALREAQITGSVTLMVIINEDGSIDTNPENIVVVESTHKYFEQSAREAAVQQRFSPPLDLKGRPARISYKITFRYTLN